MGVRNPFFAFLRVLLQREVLVLRMHRPLSFDVNCEDIGYGLVKCRNLLRVFLFCFLYLISNLLDPTTA